MAAPASTTRGRIRRLPLRPWPTPVGESADSAGGDSAGHATPIVFSLVANPMAAGAGKSYLDHLPNVTGVWRPHEPIWTCSISCKILSDLQTHWHALLSAEGELSSTERRADREM